MQEADENLEKLRLKKAEVLLKRKSIPTNVIEIKSVEEFNTLIKNYPEKIIIIDFWAVWCGPCMFFAPIFKKLQEEYHKDFIFVKVNVDEIPPLAMKYQITGIPTTLFVKNDEIVNKIVGSMNYDGMKKVLDKLKQ
ncbi:MAG: thioredoxin [Candidatus Odinarchaeota archaeon]